MLGVSRSVFCCCNLQS